MKCIHQSMEVFPYKYDAGGGFSLGLEKSWLRRWRRWKNPSFCITTAHSDLQGVFS